MITTDLASLRRRLVEDCGVPTQLAQSETKGNYLAALLDMRLQGEEPNVRAACDAAGIDHATPRQWRRRSPAFASAEWRARYSSAEGLPEIEADAPPAPEKIRELRERHSRAVEVCRSIGPGPWGNAKTKNARAQRTGAYSENRDVAIDTASALRAYGFPQDLVEPPPLGEYPPERKRGRPIHDTSGYLWPTSLHPELHRQRRRS